MLNSGFAEAGLNAISSDSLVLGSSHDSMVESSSPARNDRSESQLVSFADDDASVSMVHAWLLNGLLLICTSLGSTDIRIL